MKARPAGFTLLDLIVVIGIFAIFAAMAYGGLDSVLKTRVRVEASLDRTEQFERAYLRLRGDFQNAANRPIRDIDGSVLPTFVFDNYAKRVEFTRGGWLNLLSQPRATLERVAYSLDDRPSDGSLRNRTVDKQLVRRSWRVLDRAPQTEAVQTVLLQHVDDLSWRFLDTQNQYQEVWPATTTGQSSVAVGNGAAVAPPVAVELRLTTRDWGELRFLFRLGAEGMSTASTATATTSAGSTTGTTTGTTTGSTTGTTTGTTTGSTTGTTTGGSGNE